MSKGRTSGQEVESGEQVEPVAGVSVGAGVVSDDVVVVGIEAKGLLPGTLT